MHHQYKYHSYVLLFFQTAKSIKRHAIQEEFGVDHVPEDGDHQGQMCLDLHLYE